MNDEKQKPNYFVRTLIVLLACFCGSLVLVSFVKSDPNYTISAAAFSTLVLMTIIVLSEAFNHLSLGKVLSLSKKINEKSEENSQLKQDNTSLRESLVKLSIAVRQTQTNTTINTLPQDLLKLLGVTKAEKTDEDESIEEMPTQPVPAAITPEKPEAKSFVRDADFRQRRKFRQLIEDDALDKHLKKQEMPIAEVSKEVQFTTAFQNIDPIMERRAVFDAYLKTANKEFFLEVVTSVSPMIFDRLYVMLAKILFYRQAKQVSADLTLIVVKLPDSVSERFGSADSIERLLQMFQPAISNNLLRVEIVSYSEQEIQNFQLAASQNESHP